ncbi:ABC transporter substrate-binding protein [Thaumasiovibrio subtropicus]|uniref:ABC transporter substrate-binding protein n=1 Tax=Thaumasiovibrio subtropicus TaxID=1891207 RepID=UPI000B352291|nr:ABC transporter substrate-binding protein [Thaumasiovibrio subtropicus]
MYFKTLLLLCAIFLTGNAIADSHKSDLHFVLITQRAENDAFWGPTEEFARAVNNNLNITITIMYARSSKAKMLENLHKAKRMGADGVIFPNLKRSALDMLELAEELEIPVILFNADISDENQALAGNPQQKFKYWVARVMPDDEGAGYLLAKSLIAQARHKGLADADGHVKIVAINGTITDSPAILRAEGLYRAVKEDGNASVVQHVHAFWEQDTARFKAARLQTRFPDSRAYWAASDLMAIGINEALNDLGWRQGADYVTGGIDWSQEGLSGVSDKSLHTSIGGQFTEAAWCAIILHDYLHDAQLKSQSGDYNYRSRMENIEPAQAELLLPRITNKDWQGLDFRSRSAKFNSDISHYELDPASIFAELQPLE